MRLWEGFSLALKNIRASKMRTLLTMLGIIIGVMAVIVIVGLGNGLSGYVAQSFSSLGTNTLTVMISGRGNSTRSISVDQMYGLMEAHSDQLALLSPTVTLSGTVKAGGETSYTTSSTGVSEDYLQIKDYDLRAGRGISYGDISQRKQVCVIGAYVSRTYFDGGGVGQTLRVGGNTFSIVGVLDAVSDEPEEGGTDDMILLPYSTAGRLSSTGRINNFTLTMHDENQAAQCKTLVEDALYEIFEDSSSYNVISMSEMLESMNSTISMLVAVLAGIAAISLLVGGIGIMNIMLVSVTERTREIGIRKSLGAKERSILQQFVIEAAVTSALGGAIGIVLGYLLSTAASTVVTAVMEASFQVDPGLSAALFAFGISAGIGVLFGFLPARKAAQLNPIDALRFD